MRRISAVAFAAAFGLLVLAPVTPVAAVPPPGCPDRFFLVPSVFAPEKDRNGNGFVCLKEVGNGQAVAIDDRQ